MIIGSMISYKSQLWTLTAVTVKPLHQQPRSLQDYMDNLQKTGTRALCGKFKRDQLFLNSCKLTANTLRTGQVQQVLSISTGPHTAHCVTQ